MKAGFEGNGRGYVQLFVYRIPKKNHDAIRRLLGEIADLVKKHGALDSDFFQLHSTEAFQGFVSIAGTISAVPDEELWLEMDYYRERSLRDQAMAKIGKDDGAGPLFRQLRGLVSPGYSIVMGEFERAKM